MDRKIIKIRVPKSTKSKGKKKNAILDKVFEDSVIFAETYNVFEIGWNSGFIRYDNFKESRRVKKYRPFAPLSGFYGNGYNQGNYLSYQKSIGRIIKERKINHGDVNLILVGLYNQKYKKQISERIVEKRKGFRKVKEKETTVYEIPSHLVQKKLGFMKCISEFNQNKGAYILYISFNGVAVGCGNRNTPLSIYICSSKEKLMGIIKALKEQKFSWQELITRIYEQSQSTDNLTDWLLLSGKQKINIGIQENDGSSKIKNFEEIVFNWEVAE